MYREKLLPFYLCAIVALGSVALAQVTPSKEGRVAKLEQLPAGEVPNAGAAQAPSFRAFETFDRPPLLNWLPIRFDPTHVSLVKHPGNLTLTTQRGDIHADASFRGQPLAKNIFVIDNPLAPEVDFVVTTRLLSFQPKGDYHQAGLICYDDDDNYLKWVVIYSRVAEDKAALHILREAGRQSVMKEELAPPDTTRDVWLRFTKRGKSYEYASSPDGRSFNVYGNVEWGNGAPKKLGVLAINGGPKDVPDIDARFDSFELRTPSEKD